MLNYLLMTVYAMLVGLTMVSKKVWQKKTVGMENAMPVFLGVTAICSVITFYITARGNIAINGVTFIYAFLYAALAILSILVSFGAISKMSLVLHAVFANLGTLLIWLYGIVFMNDEITVKNSISALLFATTIFVPIIGTKRNKTSVLGYILGFLLALINASSTILVKYYAMSPAKMSDSTLCFYTNVFMLAAILIWQIFSPQHRPDMGDIKKVKGALLLIPIASVGNNIAAIINLFVLKTMPLSVYSILSAALGCVVVFINSGVIFREKIKSAEVISLILSTGAIIISVI